MSSVKCRIAAAGQHPAPKSGLVKTVQSFGKVHAGVTFELAAAQIFPGRFIAIQPVVCKWDSFRTDEGIRLWIIAETIFLRRIGELDHWVMSGNAKQFQPAVNGTGFISTIQSKSFDPVKCFL